VLALLSQRVKATQIDVGRGFRIKGLTIKLKIGDLATNAAEKASALGEFAQLLTAVLELKMSPFVSVLKLKPPGLILQMHLVASKVYLVLNSI
jgi:hypothetical protein